MMPRAARLIGILGLLVAIALVAAPAYAQLKLGEYEITGEGTMGVRQLYGERRNATFSEYRDINQGFYIEDLKINIDKPGYYYELRAQDLLENTRRLGLSMGIPGVYRLDINWTQIQHVFKTNAKTPYSGVGGDNLTIDLATRTNIQNGGSSTADANSLFNNGHKEEIKFNRDKGEVDLKYHFRPEWTLNIRYSNERWDGTRPLSALFGNSPGGNPDIEIPKPIDWRNDQLHLALEWSRGANAVEIAYDVSLFNNRYNSLTYNNPLRATDQAATIDVAHGTANSQPTMGRFALEPDSEAHYLTLTGAFQLPAMTRVVGTFSYGWLTQDQAFLPHTTNSVLYTTGADLSLPKSSLNGEMNPTMVNLVLTNRAIQNLTITGRYHFYQLGNDTSSITFPGHTNGDYSSYNEAVTAHVYDFKRQSAGVDLSYRVNRNVKVNGGYEWKKSDYVNYDASNTQDDKIHVSADFKMNGWLTIRPRYTYTNRDNSGYKSFIPVEELDQTMFNLAKSKTHEFKLMSIVVVNSQVSVNTEISYGTTNYDSQNGLDRTYFWNAGFDVNYAPFYGVNTYAGFTHETTYGKLHSIQNRYSGGNHYEPQNAWTSEWWDDYNVARAGIEILILENKPKNQRLTSTTEMLYSYGLGDYNTSYDTPATFNAGSRSAENYPDVKSQLWQITTRLDYKLSKNFTIGAMYQYDRYRYDDYTQMYVVPVPATINANYWTMGDPYDNYEAHTAAVYVKWNF